MFGRSRKRGLTPFSAGAELTADVADLSHEGRGIARADGPGGKVTFIRGALPGERVRYRLYRHGKQADEGELTVIEQASKDRVEPRCKHFGVCGGCSVQHLSPAGQAAFKQKQLLDALALRKLREIRARSMSAGLVFTIQQPGPGEPLSLTLHAVDGRGWRTQLLQLPTPAELEED